MIDDTKISEIQCILTRLIESVRNNRDLNDFDTVEIPFQLTQACIQLWTDCFSLPMLQNLADNDSETLEIWAIALNTTLQAQLGILNQWTPLLSAGYLPPKLREKTERRTHELDNIANVKSKLIQASANLLSQETELRNASAELSVLQKKVDELQSMKLDLDATDLVKLRADVSQKESDLIPQKAIIEQLYLQKNQLDIKLTSLNQQRKNLTDAIENRKLYQEQQELGALTQIQTLLALTEQDKADLDATLSQALKNLDRQIDEYNQEWERLQQTIIVSKESITEIESIRANLDPHYQVNLVLGKVLPVARDRWQTLTQSIQEQLIELDREIQTAFTQHERLQQKKYIDFRKKP